MKKTIADLRRIIQNSPSELNAATLAEIKLCLKDGVNPFITYTGSKGKHDPLVYLAIKICSPEIVLYFLNHAKSVGKKIDLSYYMYDTNRDEPGYEEAKYEWNVLQNALIFRDLATVQLLCNYAEETGQNPKKLINETILIGESVEQTSLFVGEIMVGANSVQSIGDLNEAVYSAQEREDLKGRVYKWMTGKDISLADELSAENPLQLQSNCRYEIFAYLLDKGYINFRETTSGTIPFYALLDKVTRKPAFACALVKAHSRASIPNIEAHEKNGYVTATGLLMSMTGAYTLPIQSKIDFRPVTQMALNKIKAEMMAEKEENERLKHLELLRAAAPAPVINRRSFDEVRDEVKEVSKTVANISEVRIKRYNSSKSFEEKAFFNTVYQTILTHMSARKLTATELLDANPVSRNAKIGKLLQTTFSIAMTASPAAQALPEITKVFLNVATSHHAKKQSQAVFQAYLMSSVETMLLDLSERITTEVMELYRNQRDTADFGTIAAEVADIIIKRSDRELHHADITNEDQLFTFLLKQSLIALDTQGKKDKADPFALHALQLRIRDMSSNTLPTSGSEVSDNSSGRNKQQMVGYKGYEGQEPKKNGPGGCCNIS